MTQVVEVAAPYRAGWSGRALRRRALALLRRTIAEGSLTVQWPGGGRTRVQGAAPGLDAELIIVDWRAVRRMIVGGGVGVAEAYVDGDWETPDLPGLVEFVARNRRLAGHGMRPHPIAQWQARLRHWLRHNNPSGSRRNIAFHYDMGNAFFDAWLDPSMTYSSAVFEGDGQDLADAQRNKYARLLDRLGARPGERLLEVGCGWGGFARYAAAERGLEVTALTISREQYELARRRVHEDGLAEKVEVVMRDYRAEDGRYDHVASIEMFEAVGEAYWPAFFAKIAQCLKPGGRAALQIITIDDALFESYRRGVDFIQAHIFPGGMLPSEGALRREVAMAGLAWHEAEWFGQHYARTLAEWRRRFQAAWPELTRQGFDGDFRRLWTYYLAYCEGGFRAGNIDVAQIALARP